MRKILIMRVFINWVKGVLGLKTKKQCAKPNISHSYTLGDPDENGICDLYRDGEKTKTRLLTFTASQSEKLLKVVDKIYNENH